MQGNSWLKEILGSGKIWQGKMAENPFWNKIGRKYNELPR
jgi:hypothetical protein